MKQAEQIVPRPLVSIVTPVLNQVDFIEQTIKSVLEQQYNNIEYIVIDGGSTDGSIKIIRKYEKYLKYWISEKDNGMYDAINKGLKKSHGEILAYLCADDVYYPDTVKTAVDYLQNDRDIKLVYGNCDFINSEGKFVYRYRYPVFNLQYYLARNWSSIPQPTSFWKHDIHKTVGYFDTSFQMAGDFDFYAKVGKRFGIAHVAQINAKYRIHENTLSYKGKVLNTKEKNKIYRRYRASKGWKLVLVKIIAELQIKLLNFPLMIKKVLSFTNSF